MNSERNAGGAGADRDPALDRLYAAAAREEPPAQLDAALTAAARRAVHAGPARFPLVPRAWRAPLAMAAVIVLSVSAVVLMREEEPGRTTEPVPALAPGPSISLPDEPPPPAGLAPSGPRPESAPSADADVARLPRPGEASEADVRRRQAADQAPALAESHRQAESDQPAASATSPTEPAGPAAAPRALGGGGQPQARILSREPQPGMVQEAPAQADRPVAPVPPAATPPRDAASRSLPAKPGTDFAQAKVRSRAKVESAEQRAEGEASREDRPPWSALEGQPPERWLARIEELRRAGRDGEANDVLSEFRKRYPGHAVPPAAGK